jgi:hypothetical protein
MSAAAISSGVASTKATARGDGGGFGHQGVGGPDLCSHTQQQLGDSDGGRIARVPGFLLVGEPQQQYPGPIMGRPCLFRAKSSRRATESGMWLLMSLVSSTNRKPRPSSSHVSTCA